MNRTQLMERLDPLLNMKFKNIETSPRTKLEITPDMIVLRPGDGSKMMEIASEGITSIAKYTGFPEKLTQDLSNGIASSAMSELLRKKECFSLFTKDNKVVSIGKPKDWKPINTDRLFNTLEKSMPVQDYNRVMCLDNHIARIEVVGEKRTVVPGSAIENDVIAGGAIINYSPIGTIQPSIQSFILRVWCTNGATTPLVSNQFTYGGGEGDDMWQWFRNTVRSAYTSVERITQRFGEMANQQIPPQDRAAILESMLKEAHIRGENAKAIHAEALNNPPGSSWDMMNLITWGSSHVLENPIHIIRAQNTASNFIAASDHQRICPVCHALRRGQTSTHSTQN